MFAAHFWFLASVVAVTLLPKSSEPPSPTIRFVLTGNMSLSFLAVVGTVSSYVWSIASKTKTKKKAATTQKKAAGVAPAGFSSKEVKK